MRRYVSQSDLERLLRRLRLAPGSPQADEAGALWGQALELARPAWFAALLPRQEFLRRFAPHAQASLRLMRRLEGFSGVWVLAATLGPDLEDQAARLFAQGRPFGGYVLERMGAYLADRAMRSLTAHVACIGPVGKRYSPGYLDFSLKAQAPLVAMAREKLPQLGLTSGFALTPGMSVTAVMGAASVTSAYPQPARSTPE